MQGTGGFLRRRLLWWEIPKTDLDAAKNAGILSIGCLYGFRDKKELEEHGAKYLVKDGEELWQVLEENFLEK